MATESQPKMITLKTADDRDFEVESEVAMEFTIIKAFFEDNSDISDHTVVPLLEVKSEQLEKILEFCKAHLEFRATTATEETVEAFDTKFVKKLDNEELKNMTVATNYLDAKELLKVLTQGIADRIANKSVVYVRKFFGIVNDFTPEEEEAIKNEHEWAHEGVDPDDDPFLSEGDSR